MPLKKLKIFFGIEEASTYMYPKSECVHRSRATCGRLGVGWVSAQKWFRLLLATCCLGIHTYTADYYCYWLCAPLTAASGHTRTTGQASPIFKATEFSHCAANIHKDQTWKHSWETTCEPCFAAFFHVFHVDELECISIPPWSSLVSSLYIISIVQ